MANKKEKQAALSYFIRYIAPSIRAGLSGEERASFDVVLYMAKTEHARLGKAGRPPKADPRPRTLETRRYRERVQAKLDALRQNKTARQPDVTPGEDWGA